MTTPDILRTSTTAAITDPITKKHLIEMAESAALRSGKGGGGGGSPSQADNNNSGGATNRKQTKNAGAITLATKEIRSVLDESSLILSSQFLGNVASHYQPPPPPPFVPVTEIKRKRKKKKKAPVASDDDTSNNKTNNSSPPPRHAAGAGSDASDDAGSTSYYSSDGEASAKAAGTATSNKNDDEDEEYTTTTKKPLLASFASNNLPSLSTAAPARNLCVELLSTRVVACVRAVSLLLQDFASSPGQSLPHVALLGAGNVGHTILTHLVKLLPPDRIVVLARDSKSEVCTHFSNKFGVRSLSTNILQDAKLVEVVRNHRNQQLMQQQRKAGGGSPTTSAGLLDGTATTEFNFGSRATATATATDIIGSDKNNNTSTNSAGNSVGFGGGARGGTPTAATTTAASAGASASHVSPEVAAAHNVSVALQQVHVLIVACRPAQLPEVASSLQPWLRSSSVVILSTLVGVTADRIAQLFRVPSSLSVTVDTTEMLFAFESASMLHARNNSNNGTSGAKTTNDLLESSTASFQQDNTNSRQLVVSSGPQQQLVNNKLRFFTREPLDFVHRLFFALVSTLLERCGVGPKEAWAGVAKLLLGRPAVAPPSDIGAQGPSLVSKCSVQCLAAAAKMTVGEVMTIVDTRMTAFAGVKQH